MSNNANNSLPTVQISLWIVALFQKIYDGEPILTVFFFIGEDVQHCCFSYVHVLCENYDAARNVFGNNYYWK
jgi:hypothetical protein